MEKLLIIQDVVAHLFLVNIPMSTGSAHLNSATQIVSVESAQHFFCPYQALPNTPFLGSAISVYTYISIVTLPLHFPS